MRDLWWKLVDAVVVGVCLVLMLSDWLDRRETRKLLLRLSPYRPQEPFDHLTYFDPLRGPHA